MYAKYLCRIEAIGQSCKQHRRLRIVTLAIYRNLAMYRWRNVRRNADDAIGANLKIKSCQVAFHTSIIGLKRRESKIRQLLIEDEGSSWERHLAADKNIVAAKKINWAIPGLFIVCFRFCHTT